VIGRTCQRQALQAHAFFTQGDQVVMLDRKTALQHFQRDVEALQLAQGDPGADPGVSAKRGDRRLIG